VLMAIGAKAENVLAASHWIHDQQDALFALGFRDRHERRRLPSQATLYRFFWMLEANIERLERALHQWAADVLYARRHPGEMVRVGMDGKRVRASKRSRQGDSAVHLLSCFIHSLGLTLLQGRVSGDEAVTGNRLLAQCEGLEGIPWLFTGDAAFAERPLVEAVLEKRGMYLLDLKDNLAEVKHYAEWAFSLERTREDSFFETDEVRSGEVWIREVETRPATADVTNAFPGAAQFVRCVRTVVRKDTGEIRFRETEYGLTSSLAPAEVLYSYWRGHWEIENRSHHKRDTIWREDACRTRKGAQTFAALRNLMLSLFHLNGPEQVLRQARRCSAQPHRLLSLLGVR
jgi:predicted transposase YbfD/YdcC